MFRNCLVQDAILYHFTYFILDTIFNQTCFQDERNLPLLREKTFSQECVGVCVKETREMKNIEELLDFFLVANNETRRNVTGLIKEAINSSVKVRMMF